MSSPTSRSMDFARKNGWMPGVVEKWNHHTNVRQDLWGFIDLLVVTPEEVIAVQATSGSNAAARVTKILGVDAAKTWLGPSRSIEVWSWTKRQVKTKPGAKNPKRVRYTLERRAVTADMFERAGEDS